MREKKKKNGPENTNQRFLIACLILLVAIALASPFIVRLPPFMGSSIPLMETNPLVMTSLAETSIAGTQQYFLTNSPTPAPIPT